MGSTNKCPAKSDVSPSSTSILSFSLSPAEERQAPRTSLKKLCETHTHTHTSRRDGVIIRVGHGNPVPLGSTDPSAKNHDSWDFSL